MLCYAVVFQSTLPTRLPSCVWSIHVMRIVTTYISDYINKCIIMWPMKRKLNELNWDDDEFACWVTMSRIAHWNVLIILLHEAIWFWILGWAIKMLIKQFWLRILTTTTSRLYTDVLVHHPYSFRLLRNQHAKIDIFWKFSLPCKLRTMEYIVQVVLMDWCMHAYDI